MFHDLLAVIEPEIVAQRAWDDAIAIHRIDRRFTFSAFAESARYTAQRMREAGLQDVEVLEAPADGESIFGDWKMPMAWEVEEATFDLVLPNGDVQRIADRAQVPLCLAMWSGPTPPEGIEAEIVVVENVADPGQDLRGKIAFISSHPHFAKKTLADRGALGILTDFLHPGADLPDAVAWINSFSDDPAGWAFHKGDTPLWCFQVSPREGERVRALVGAHSSAPLRGRAVVRSRLEPGTVPVITGLVPGTGKEEVVLIGHQFEVGAIDNASGVAAMLEAGRALQSLIAQGKLPQPERSVRLLFVSECYSNLYWWEKSRRARRTVAGLCLDSPVGVPEYGRRPTLAMLNPHFQMSYTDALVLELLRQVMPKSPLYAWGEAPFSMTDNLIVDSTIGVACPWIGAHSRTWHTSMDTADKLPVRELGLSALVAAAYVYVIASAGPQQAVDLAHLAAARGKQVLAAAGVTELTRLGEADLDDSLLQLGYLAERQAEAVESVMRLVSGEARASTRSYLRALQREVRRAGKEEEASLARRAGKPGHTPAPQPCECVLEGIRPRRLVLGPVCFDRVPAEEQLRHGSPRWSAEALSVLGWCDGRTSLSEAARRAAREHRADRTLRADELAKRIDPAAASLRDYFEFLRKYGYVTW